MSIPGKVFASAYTQPPSTNSDRRHDNGRASRVQKGRGCAEQKFLMRQLAQKIIGKGSMYAVFVDLEKA